MSIPANIDKKTQEPVSPVYKRPVPKKTREAIRLRVREGLTWDQCAQRVDMKVAALYKAIKQPHVKAFMIMTKDEFIQDVEQMRAPYKAQAFEVARELLHTSKSDTVKARMVEFLAGEPKGNAVNVAVQVNNAPPQGYEYVRPGQDVVKIIDASDTTSSEQGPSDSA